MNAIKNNDLISVLIPAYNHSKYIQATINSILQQDYSNIELIIINDGSTDATDEVIKSLEENCKHKLNNFIHINKENEGIIKTLNLALKLAQGKYIYIIASDDIAETNALSILHKFLVSHQEYGLAVGKNYLIDNNGKRCFWNKEKEIIYSRDKAFYLSHDECLQKNKPDVDFNNDNFGEYTKILAGNHVPNGYLIRKSIMDKIGGYSEQSPLEDLYLMLQISKITKLKFINQPLFFYRWHNTNSIKSEIKIGQMQHQTILQERNYCIKNGFFLQWLKRAYLPGIHYRWSKIGNTLNLWK